MELYTKDLIESEAKNNRKIRAEKYALQDPQGDLVAHTKNLLHDPSKPSIKPDSVAITSQEQPKIVKSGMGSFRRHPKFRTTSLKNLDPKM